uniref:Glycosyl transferase, family 2 n=1 Tax=uncultured bacterium lac146 TaxID=1447238 RepID=X2LC86_9BACT|nr:Glycosyl transferase, family 2 [uncultured bacterium lac146]
MFDCITKKEYWATLDQKSVWSMLKSSPGDLKHIQDAWMWSQLNGCRGSKIIEIGGGNSRVLLALDPSNELWNVDEFTGNAGGPNQVVERPGIRTVVGNLGAFSDSLPSSYFDTLFSISVIEHVPSGKPLDDFFMDACRILKVGGRSYHAIDIYLGDDFIDYASKRIQEYLDAIQKSGQALIEPSAISAQTKFSCRYASNPDLGMYGWNKAVPQLAAMREATQSCSLKLVTVKK